MACSNPACSAVAQPRRVQVSPTQSNHALGWRQLVATTSPSVPSACGKTSPVQLSPTQSNLCKADRPTSNLQPPVSRAAPFAIQLAELRLRHFPLCALCASVAKQPPVKPSPTESNRVQPCEADVRLKPCTRGGDSLSPQHSRCPLPPRSAACGYGPRLWQSPAAALRPAGRPNLKEASCPISPSVPLWQNQPQSNPVQLSPTQSKYIPIIFPSPKGGRFCILRV